jgi:hypothetical protein
MSLIFLSTNTTTESGKFYEDLLAKATAFCTESLRLFKFIKILLDAVSSFTLKTVHKFSDYTLSHRFPPLAAIITYTRIKLMNGCHHHHHLYK